MLHERYLPACNFSETHSILIDRPPEAIWPIIVEGDMSGSWIIRFLFALRGMPARMTTIRGLNKGRFITLELKENQELIIGLIGQFWKASGNLQIFQPEDFTEWNKKGFLKATWNFELIPTNNGTKIITETRILCLGDDAHRKFRKYWFFIRPFSGIIRKEILRGIKKKATASQ